MPPVPLLPPGDDDGAVDFLLVVSDDALTAFAASIPARCFAFIFANMPPPLPVILLVSVPTPPLSTLSTAPVGDSAAALRVPVCAFNFENMPPGGFAVGGIVVSAATSVSAAAESGLAIAVPPPAALVFWKREETGNNRIAVVEGQMVRGRARRHIGKELQCPQSNRRQHAKQTAISHRRCNCSSWCCWTLLSIDCLGLELREHDALALCFWRTILALCVQGGDHHSAHAHART